MKNKIIFSLRYAFPTVLALLAVNHCGAIIFYTIFPWNGVGKAVFSPPRQINTADIGLPCGYCIEPVAIGLTFPSGVITDDKDRVYVVEAGYSYGEAFATPRLLRIEADGGKKVIAEGKDNGPWTGASFYKGAFYISEGGELKGGRILRVTMDGKITPLIENLPSMGDHHTNRPVIGSDGYIYFGVGTATNSGVVGSDNAQFGFARGEVAPTGDAPIGARLLGLGRRRSQSTVRHPSRSCEQYPLQLFFFSLDPSGLSERPMLTVCEDRPYFS
ncbi:MAG: hypothetical protein ACJ8FY_12930 [Gemmataceae bacterium]